MVDVINISSREDRIQDINHNDTYTKNKKLREEK